ncbi:hypothetical protein [Emticicia oligotrophica]|nr:hypothetical protein [Emticicia oligotrophica]
MSTTSPDDTHSKTNIKLGIFHIAKLIFNSEKLLKTYRTAIIGEFKIAIL